MQCGNIALRTNRAEGIYGIRTYHIYIYIYRQFSVFTTSVGLAALAPIKKCTEFSLEIVSTVRVAIGSGGLRLLK